MKFIKKNWKKLLIIIIIIVLIILIILLINIFVKKDIKPNDTDSPQNSELEIAKELIKNNYIYSYLVSGDIKTESGYITVENVNYYYINDGLLESINSLEDMSNLIENTFIKGKFSSYFDNLKAGHKYFESNGNLYVAKANNICQEFQNYDAEDISITSVTDDEMVIKIADGYAYAYKENDKWHLGMNYIYCLSDLEDDVD